MNPQILMSWDDAEVARRNYPIIIRLQESLRRALRASAGSARDYALLDFPQYANIGDSAIYVGEAILCREHFGRAPALVTEASNAHLERIERLPPDVVILMQGGGNFGDLYPRHQLFREAVVSRFRDRKIVLLPQSLYFEDEENARASAKIFNAHPDFTMMVRDHESLAIAKRHFRCPVMLVPDMAFMIGAITPPVQPDLKVLGLIRDDKEAILDRDGLTQLPRPYEIVDWPAERRPRQLSDRLPAAVRTRLPGWAQGWRPANPAGYERLARHRLRTGLHILSRGEVVLTDRLHAHILSVLLGKRQIVLDNSYRKIGNYIDAWMDGTALVQTASVSEAVSILRG